MALIRCPDCQHDISDQAPACPHCGRPVVRQQHESGRQSRMPRPITLAYLFLIVVCVVYMAMRREPSSSAPTALYKACSAAVGELRNQGVIVRTVGALVMVKSDAWSRYSDVERARFANDLAECLTAEGTGYVTFRDAADDTMIATASLATGYVTRPCMADEAPITRAAAAKVKKEADAANARLAEQNAKFCNTLRASLVMDIRKEREVYVSRAWYQLSYEEKEAAVNALSKCLAPAGQVGLFTVYDGYSGAELASRGMWGVSIEKR